MKNQIIALILALSIGLTSSTAFAYPCDDFMTPLLSQDEAIEIAETYSKKMGDLPQELQLAVKEGLLGEAQLNAYLKVQAKWDKRGKILGKAFQKSGVWRKMIDNPKFLTDYASNVASGSVTTILYHLPFMRANAALDTPLLTVDMLSGFITDSELSLVAAANPGYLKELKRRGLMKPGMAEVTTQKMNKILDRVKAISFKRYLKKRKAIDLKSDEITADLVKKSKIPAKYIGETRKHIKGMLQLSYYFTIAGAMNGMAYKGLQGVMGKIGYTLDDPYVGFSVFSEAAYLAEFSVHAYARIVLTDKIVGKARSMVDDYFEGLKYDYMKNPGNGMISAERLEWYNTMKNFFLGAATIGIFFASNYWATDVYMRWRDGDFDLSLLLFPYQKELNEFIDVSDEAQKNPEQEQKSMNAEIEKELKSSEEYQWFKAQEVLE